MRVRLEYDLIPKDAKIAYLKREKLKNIEFWNKIRVRTYIKNKLDLDTERVQKYLRSMNFKKFLENGVSFFSQKNILVELSLSRKLENEGESPAIISVSPKLESYNQESRDILIETIEKLAKEFDLKIFDGDEKKVVTPEQMKRRLKTLKIREGTYEDIVRDAEHYSKDYGRKLN